VGVAPGATPGYERKFLTTNIYRRIYLILMTRGGKLYMRYKLPGCLCSCKSYESGERLLAFHYILTPKKPWCIACFEKKVIFLLFLRILNTMLDYTTIVV
jgi:hypothetical protein